MGCLSCPSCGGRETTLVPGGSIGWSEMEVTCDDCGEQYMFAINFFAWLARAELDQQT
jgi:hypothetical protein